MPCQPCYANALLSQKPVVDGVKNASKMSEGERRSNARQIVLKHCIFVLRRVSRSHITSHQRRTEQGRCGIKICTVVVMTFVNVD